MVLIENVYSREGYLLIPKDTILTERFIDKLVEFGAARVNIDSDGIYDGYLQEFDTAYNTALTNVEDLFLTAKHKRSVDISDFAEIIKPLLVNLKIGRHLIVYMKFVDCEEDFIFQHSVSVCVLSLLMGKWMGYDEENLKILGLAAILHDIGKIMVPEIILNKPDKLTADEYNIVKNHTRYGYQILKNSEVPDEVIRSAALAHHERVDGKGYPFGLKGTMLNEKVRIISICDMYDAITSERPYKESQNPLKGYKIISDNSYKGLDPYLCKVFVNNGVAAFDGCNVTLSDGRVGKIIKASSENPAKPWVIADNKFINLEMNSDVDIVEII